MGEHLLDRMVEAGVERICFVIAPGKTEILLLEARLLEVKTIGNQTIATVLFDAMLREDSAAAPAEQVREAWHFSRYETGGGSHWVVEGIQQLET